MYRAYRIDYSYTSFKYCSKTPHDSGQRKSYKTVFNIISSEETTCFTRETSCFITAYLFLDLVAQEVLPSH